MTILLTFLSVLKCIPAGSQDQDSHHHQAGREGEEGQAQGHRERVQVQMRVLPPGTYI